MNGRIDAGWEYEDHEENIRSSVDIYVAMTKALVEQGIEKAETF